MASGESGKSISIHAPLAGCDHNNNCTQRKVWEFQSTHPLRGATRFPARACSCNCISIHAPLAGCDSASPATMAATSAYFNPRTPCGVRQRCGRNRVPERRNFNPRTPCGVRPGFFARLLYIIRFQSTHPLRGATLSDSRMFSSVGFQSTHPLRGATSQFNRLCKQPYHFNPRTPCGVRPLTARCPLIAILFQSTHPLRGATSLLCHDERLLGISIHAPLAGCDYSPRNLTPASAISIHAPLAGCD